MAERCTCALCWTKEPGKPEGSTEVEAALRDEDPRDPRPLIHAANRVISSSDEGRLVVHALADAQDALAERDALLAEARESLPDHDDDCQTFFGNGACNCHCGNLAERIDAVLPKKGGG